MGNREWGIGRARDLGIGIRKAEAVCRAGLVLHGPGGGAPAWLWVQGWGKARRRDWLLRRIG
ncbi:hypothetical protein XACW160_860027 [Xanthomonas citri pv. citri]|uniref:Uncharacterized protein n=1 Tax=Xanthomonas citri pv. citri TaxID=611301 RepID=A0A0U5FE05_XANCI|nr:hypothetical protein XAC3824_1020037 [Xanthomonas citri pv. citri]CEE22687.1 hypothetical protein XAC902_1170037 [Xanthomonas citri pv. citri]CEE25543.1 hypothetical protein XAC908_1230036 [Xanthomonas citri pv. citri]CEE43750.1 hypothetical protein XAC9322_820041 [Xanthomonas citri pv. citri]CEE44443.1 hypothetical protein XAC1083_860041 [Xanthomonas citri pv. citri]